MEEFTPKTKAIQTIVDCLAGIDAQFQDAMKKAEYEAGGAAELPAEHLIPMLKFGDRIKRLQAETRHHFLPAETKPKKEKHVKTWDERARDILNRI
jgi:hypothetical protein